MRITVIGTGYLGATHAACMAHLGHHVYGLDNDEAKIAALSQGKAPFYEPGLNELLREGLDSGRLQFGTSYEDAAHFGRVHFLTLGTPQGPEGQADLSQIDSALASLTPHLQGEHTIIGKSTVPPGTANRLAAQYPNVRFGWNPEFLREGHAVNDTLHPDRIVVGGDVRDTLTEVYAPIAAPTIYTDLVTAELAKTAANAFLATKVSFINGVAEVCDASGGDILALQDILGLDERIGSRYLHAGAGFGGGCLPKDIRAFATTARHVGATDLAHLLDSVDAINANSRQRVVAACGDVAGKEVTVLGTSFKPGSDDIRDSPALAIAAQLTHAGALVTTTDPHAPSTQPDTLAALDGADVVVLATEWDEYRTLDPRVVARRVRQRILVDGRNALDHDAWRAAGFTVYSLGRNFRAAE